MHLIKKLILFFFLIPITSLYSQGVKGYLYGENEEKLPFATIYVAETQSGTTTNGDGYFEIALTPGTYTITFQFMGYQTATKTIQTGSTFTTLNVTLKPTVVELKTAVVYATKEDPGYTIMRKAIAKAPFHRYQLASYNAQVYMKGAGRVIDAPFFIRKKLAEEGLDSNTAFISETVTNVHYAHPNIYTQKVISSRTSGDNGNSSSYNNFVFGSFYQPTVGNVVSPLSPNALGLYRFKYINSFEDQGYVINKIQVIPRSKGDNVVEGFLYLVEDDWSIHHVNFVTYVEGIKVYIRINYAPIKEDIWMPVTLKFDGEGSLFGVDFEYNYLATIGKYEVEVNPSLSQEIEIVDEKIDKDLAKLLEQEERASTEGAPLNSQEKITRKQAKKLMKKYTHEISEEKEKDVSVDYTFEVDSAANTRDSSYWESVRSVPLDSHEIRGYQKLDSIAVEREEERKKDSIKTNTFSALDLLFGYSKIWKDTHRITAIVPIQYNTVDGFKLGLDASYGKKIDSNRTVIFDVKSAYGFSRTTLLAEGGATLNYGTSTRRGQWSIRGGINTSQINNENPIEPLLNTLTTLFLQDNWMKIYQKQFISVSGIKQLTTRVKLEGGMEYAYREALENTTDFSLVKYHNRGFTSNTPENNEMSNTQFEAHHAVIGEAKVTVKPWQTIYKRNGKYILSRRPSPAFWLSAKLVHTPQFNASPAYHLRVGMNHKIKIHGSRRFSVNVFTGSSFNSAHVFVDYAHFMGNQSPFTNTNPANQFRMLPYYRYSTNQLYGVGHFNYEFKKLAITHIAIARLTGIKENVFVNYLYQDHAKLNYVEMGYSINNIFRVLRVEVVTNNTRNFADWAIRIGLSTSFSNGF